MRLINFIRSLFIGRERIEKARKYVAILDDSTCNLGSYGYNYNVNGGKIRDRVSRVSIDRRHPLEKRYGR